jgi:ABC-type antimicrobial peptide transport system permease subunit
LAATTHTMDEQWSDLRATPRFEAIVCGGFAGLAVIMACAGIYGVLSHIVVLRRREIGIRVAVGAKPADVQGLIIGEALMLAIAGVVIGLGGAVAGSRLLSSLLYQVNSKDPLTLAIAATLLLILAICASVVPARRASQQDPMIALRHE